MKIYKIASKQITFKDFNQPVGMHMNPTNRWIKKAEIMTWDEIEIDYAKLFKGFKGHMAKTAKVEMNHYDKSDEPSNKGTLIVDATCAPSQIKYLRRDQKIIKKLLNDGRLIMEKNQKQLNIIEKLYDQKEHSVRSRIVNLRQPYLRPIVRGKAKAPTEFGAKLDIRVVDGLYDWNSKASRLQRERTCRIVKKMGYACQVPH